MDDESFEHDMMEMFRRSMAHEYQPSVDNDMVSYMPVCLRLSNDCMCSARPGKR